MADISTVATAKTWDFNEDEASQYTLAELNTELQKNLSINISQAEFDAIDMLDGVKNSYITDDNLFALEGGSGNGLLTLNEFNEDTDTGVKTASNGRAVAWNFDGSNADDTINGKASTETGNKSDQKADTEGYSFDDLLALLEAKFGVDIDEELLTTALKSAGWNGNNSTLITDAILRNLEGDNDNGVLTLTELNADSDIAVKTTTKNISFDYDKDAKGKNGAKDNTVFSLAAELEAVLGTDIDERGLAALLGLKSLDQTFDDALIKSKLDPYSKSTNSVLTMSDITTIKERAAQAATTSKLATTYWDYDSDTKTEYNAAEFKAMLTKMGITVDKSSKAYNAIFNDNKATDEEIRQYLDKNENGILTQREAAPVAKDATSVTYTSDGDAGYRNHRGLAISIYESLYGLESGWRNDPRFKEIHDNVRTVFKGGKPISDAKIMGSALDSDKDGIIDLWVTDNNPTTKKPVVTTTTAK